VGFHPTPKREGNGREKKRQYNPGALCVFAVQTSPLKGLHQEVTIMFGIETTAIWLAYLLCILSALLCVVYGLVNWNKGAGAVAPEDRTWLEEEKELEKDL
jgi:hypothetical protein